MSKLPKPPDLAVAFEDGTPHLGLRACLDFVFRHGRLISRLTPLDDLEAFLATCRLASRFASEIGPPTEAALHWAKGIALARKGEQARSEEVLDQAAETFRWAAKLFEETGNRLDAKRAALGAVEALTRRAEMTHDRQRLHLSLALHRRHFSDRAELQRIGFGPDDHARVDCCRSIALIWIGEHGADPDHVAAVLSVLEGWDHTPHLHPETRRQVALLIVATYSIAARQSGTAAGWQKVLDVIQAMPLGRRPTLANANIHHYRARALHELGRIGKSVEMVLLSAALHRQLAGLFARSKMGRSAAMSWHASGGALSTASFISPDAHTHLAASAQEAFEEARSFFSRERNAQEWLRVQADLAEIMGLRARRSGDLLAAHRAADEFASALDAVSADASPTLFIRVACLLFQHQCASGMLSEAVATFDEMMAAQAIVLADPNSSYAVYRQLLREMREVFDLAAWCLCRLGRTSEAAAILDAGRARELTMKVRLLDEALPETSATSALSEFEALASCALAPVGPAAGPGNDAFLAAERWATFVGSRRTAARLAAEGRGLPELPEGTASVHVVMCAFGSYALLGVQGRSGGHLAIDLEGADLAALRRLVAAAPSGKDDLSWDARYRQLMAEPPGYFGRERSNARELRCTRTYSAFNDFLLGVLRLLWAALMGPVSAALADIGVDRDAVVVVCLPAMLLKLPVLAATSDDGFVFSHTWKAVLAPSLTIAARSLRLASDRTGDGTGKLLIVSNARAEVGQTGYMSYAAAEASALRELAGDRSVVALSGKEATSANVLRHMSDCEIFHASCHGSYDVASPTNSGLEVANDARITVASIWHAPRLFRKARLCFLAACESGLTQPEDLQDEFVGLAAGLVGAGSPGVICTLWPVFDDSATAVGVAFYRNFLSSYRDWSAPESAIRFALGQLRLAGWLEIGETPSSTPTGRKMRTRAAGEVEDDGEGALAVSRSIRDCPYEWAGYVLFGG